MCMCGGEIIETSNNETVIQVIYIYIYIYIYVYVRVCVRVCVCVWLHWRDHPFPSIFLSLISLNLRMSRLTCRWNEFKKAPYFPLVISARTTTTSNNDNPLGFWNTNKSTDPNQETRLCDKKKENLLYSGFWRSKVKNKERKLKRQVPRRCQRTEKVVKLECHRNIYCETVPKGLERGLEELEIRGTIETIQTTALEIWGNLLSLILQRKTISRWCEKLARSKIITRIRIINQNKQRKTNYRSW